MITAAKRTLALARNYKMPIYAIADPEIKGSEHLLIHLGFTHFKDAIWAISA